MIMSVSVLFLFFSLFTCQTFTFKLSWNLLILSLLKNKNLEGGYAPLNLSGVMWASLTWSKTHLLVQNPGLCTLIKPYVSLPWRLQLRNGCQTIFSPALQLIAMLAVLCWVTRVGRGSGWQGGALPLRLLKFCTHHDVLLWFLDTRKHSVIVQKQSIFASAIWEFREESQPTCWN